MDETMTRSPSVEALHEQRRSLDLLATLARRLSRKFGEPGSEQAWADFLVALDRERTTRAAYQSAIRARLAAQQQSEGTAP